jgi:uncharacterized membrane protein YphA (DoxX/SURF4 family)
MELLRIYLGVGLLLKGAHFISSGNDLGRAVDGMPFASTVALTHLVAVAHFGGGMLLVLGLLTRLAALVNVPVILGAILFVHLDDGLFTPAATLEFTMLILFLLILIVVNGPGRFSIDHYLPIKKLLGPKGA